MVELRELINEYLVNNLREKAQRVGETTSGPRNKITAPIPKAAPIDKKAVAAALESIASTGPPPKAGSKPSVSVPVALSPVTPSGASSSRDGAQSPKTPKAVPPPKTPQRAKAKPKAPTQTSKEIAAERLLKAQIKIHRAEAGEFGTKPDGTFRLRAKNRYETFKEAHLPI